MTTEVHSILARETVYAACASKSFAGTMGDFIKRYKRHPLAEDMIVEAMKLMAEIIDAAKLAGYTFSGDPRLQDSYAARMMRLVAEKKNPNRFMDAIFAETALLLHATNELLKAGAVVTPGKPAAPEPIRIRLEQPKPERNEPQEVKVISMPTREKTTTVERDGRENIKKTTTVETDEAA